MMILLYPGTWYTLTFKYIAQVNRYPSSIINQRNRHRWTMSHHTYPIKNNNNLLLYFSEPIAEKNRYRSTIFCSYPKNNTVSYCTYFSESTGQINRYRVYCTCFCE